VTRLVLPLLFIALMARGPVSAQQPPKAEGVLELRGNRDSDATTALVGRVQGMAAIAGDVRVGLALARTRASDPAQLASGYEATVRGEWSRSRALLLEVESGAASFSGDGSTTPVHAAAVIRGRARYRGPAGSGGEIRFRREALTATPRLLASGVMINEARARVDLPIVAPVFARGTVKAGRFSAPGEEANQRVMLGVGGVLRVSELAELGVSIHRTRFKAPSHAGYFAPERIEAAEIGTYWEHYGAWPLMFVIDAGAGLERISDWGVPASPWRPAFRLTALAGWEITPATELRIELDANDSRATGVLAPAGSAWRSGSVSTSLRVRIP
jgi:hypothetical protein